MADETRAPGAFSRLFVKYWWQLMVAVGLPLVGAVAVEAWFGYRAQLQQLERAQATQAMSIATALRASVQREAQYAARIYRIPWPGTRLERLAEELEVAMTLFPAILQATVTRGAQELLFVSQVEARRVASSDGPEGEKSATPPPLTYAAGRLGTRQLPAVFVRVPHDRRPGEHLEVALDLRAVSDLLNQAARREGSAMFVVGPDNQPISHSDPAFALATAPVRATPHLDSARTRPEETRAGLSMKSKSADGADVLATVQEVPETGWWLVVERPLEDALAPIRREAARTLVLLVVGVAFASLLAASLARRLARPVLELGHDVERIGRGELAHRTAIRTGDEIEQLGGQVNDMAARLEEYTHGLERKVAEQTTELRGALQTAHDAMRARSLFLAAASHDLRQPLYAISILADALGSHPLAPDTRAVLEKQRQAIAALRTLFDNLLDLSRLEAGEVRPMVRAVALRELLMPLAGEYQALAEARGLQWHAEVEEAWVQTDPELLRRVLANLLSNAVRYTPRGEVRLRATRDGERVSLEVSDSGIGIAPENQARVFEEFVQLENTARDRDKGVGLGLSIVKKIGDLLDLRVRLESGAGEGTRVSITLPALEAPEAAVTPEPHAEASGDIAGMRVWIAEDDALVREALAMQLDAWSVDHDFAVLREELEALRVSDGAWPDAVMLDDMLGAGEGGLELALWLGNEIEHERIAVVTGNVDPARLAAMEASGFCVLRKPLTGAELAGWLRRARALSAATPAPAAARAG